MIADGSTPEDVSGFFSKLERAPREAPSAEVARQLLSFLLSGEVKPGHRIPSERKLADALGVGRSAVREAIASLNLLGLLDIRPGAGSYLSASGSDLLPRVIEWGLLLGHSRLLDVIELRYHLEIVGAGLAAERADEQAVRELDALIDRMMETVPTIPEHVEADIAFHLRIAKASGNGVLENVLVSIQSLLRIWARRTLEYAGETQTSVKMHTPIRDAIARHDVEAARAAMAAHMADASERLHATLRASDEALPAPQQPSR